MKMRQLILSLMTVSSMIFGGQAFAQEEGKVGVGFVLGDPTALSFKYFMANDRAFDIQGSINGNDYFLVWSDYLFHYPRYFGTSHRFLELLSPYVGIGVIGALASKSDHDRGSYFDKRDDDFALGARVPFGIEWFWDKAPIAVGLEIVPGIIVAPATRGLLQGGLTLRFYF
jgi:hypothetical protein